MKNYDVISVLNLKPRAKRFEQRMKVKMIAEHIIKAFLKNKVIYCFEPIYSHGLVSITVYVFTEETRKPSFDSTSQIFDFKKMLLFLSGICFSFLTKPYANFRKM